MKIVPNKYISFMYKDVEIDKNNNTGYNVVIPDIEGAYTCGDDLLHSIKMAKDVVNLILEDVLELPKAHSLDYFTKDKLKELDIPITAVSQEIEFKEKTKKKQTITINISIEGKKIIDDYAKSHNISRSRFLENSALKVAMKS